MSISISTHTSVLLFMYRLGCNRPRGLIICLFIFFCAIGALCVFVGLMFFFYGRRRLLSLVSRDVRANGNILGGSRCRQYVPDYRARFFLCKIQDERKHRELNYLEKITIYNLGRSVPKMNKDILRTLEKLLGENYHTV